MRKKQTWLPLGLLLFMCSASGYAGGKAPKPPKFLAITTSGSGCPAGSTGSQIALDGSSLTAIFDDFLVEVSPEKKRDRADCKVVLAVKVPKNHNLEGLQVDLRGYLDIDPQVKAVVRTHYQVEELDEERRPLGTLMVKGAKEMDFPLFAAIDFDEVQNGTECMGGRTYQLHIDTVLKLVRRSPDGEGLLTLDSTDASFLLGVKTKRCVQPVQKSCQLEATVHRTKASGEEKVSTIRKTLVSEVLTRKELRQQAKEKCENLREKPRVFQVDCQIACEKQQG